MSGENELRVVFRTSQHGEAEVLAARLNDADIPTEIRIVVPASRETDAVTLIEAHMKSIGAEPSDEAAPVQAATEGLLSCLNCAAVGLTLHAPCSGCGFEILTAPDAEPPFVKDHATGSRTFCPNCRDPFTFPSGACRACGEELEPLESGDRLCPNLTHVLYRDTEGGLVCKACRRVWVALG